MQRTIIRIPRADRVRLRVEDNLDRNEVSNDALIGRCQMASASVSRCSAATPRLDGLSSGCRRRPTHAGNALLKPHLAASIQHYLADFAEDLDSFYPGINALAMLKIQLGLARAMPAIWEEGFDDRNKAAAALDEMGAAPKRGLIFS